MFGASPQKKKEKKVGHLTRCTAEKGRFSHQVKQKKKKRLEKEEKERRRRERRRRRREDEGKKEQMGKRRNQKKMIDLTREKAIVSGD